LIAISLLLLFAHVFIKTCAISKNQNSILCRWMSLKWCVCDHL